MPTVTRTNIKTPEQRRVEREALLATLGEKMAALASSEEWVAYLHFMRSFRRYSTGSIGLFEVHECSGCRRPSESELWRR